MVLKPCRKHTLISHYKTDNNMRGILIVAFLLAFILGKAQVNCDTDVMSLIKKTKSIYDTKELPKGKALHMKFDVVNVFKDGSVVTTHRLNFDYKSSGKNSEAHCQEYSYYEDGERLLYILPATQTIAFFTTAMMKDAQEEMDPGLLPSNAVDSILSLANVSWNCDTLVGGELHKHIVLDFSDVSITSNVWKVRYLINMVTGVATYVRTDYKPDYELISTENIISSIDTVSRSSMFSSLYGVVYTKTGSIKNEYKNYQVIE